MKKCKRPIAALAYCNVCSDVNARQNIRRKSSPHAPRSARTDVPPAQNFYFAPPAARGPPPPPFAPCDKIAHTHTLARCITDTVSWQYGLHTRMRRAARNAPAFTRLATLRPPWRTPVLAPARATSKCTCLSGPRPQYSQTTLQRFLQGGTHGTRLFSRSQRCCAGHQLQP